VTDFVKPPLPADDFVDANGLWDQRYGPYTKEDMQARDNELLRAVADWLDNHWVAAPNQLAAELRKATE
jgi:hypothetical protein